MINDLHSPVIVGVGEVVDRPVDLLQAMEPLTLMQAAAGKAGADAVGADGGLIAEIDSIDMVNIASWRYADAVGQLCSQMNIAPSHRRYTPVGGEQPVKLIHDAALRIARGETKVALIVGAEAQSSSGKARTQGVELPWTPFAKDGPRNERGSEMVHPLAAELGVSSPVTIYPFYEMASSARWGQTPAEALAESGEIWAKYSAVATQRAATWAKRRFAAGEITTPSADNRLIAWPYTKLMVANPQVNQGAAVILASVAHARERGVPEGRMIHVLGGAWANEPRDFMARDQFTMSHAQDAVLGAAKALTGGRFDALELYSCFPCVPKMARRTLGLGRDVEPTVTGGLTFFGAPLSNYMLHAACAMTERLRSGGGTGLLYGQGEFVTKHHALVVSSSAGKALSQDVSVQAQADAQRGAVPETVPPRPTSAEIESSTVLYQRDGSVQHGVVIARLPDGRRTIVAVAAEDAQSLAVLTDGERSPVGRKGEIIAGASGRMEWAVSV